MASGSRSTCCTRTSYCGGLSCCGAQALGYKGFSSRSSQALEHRLSSRGWLSWPLAYGIFQDQESNPHLPYWQMDSLPLSYQGSPIKLYPDVSMVCSLAYFKSLLKCHFFTEAFPDSRDFFCVGVRGACHVAHEILGPQPGIEPMPPVWECEALTTGPPETSSLPIPVVILNMPTNHPILFPSRSRTHLSSPWMLVQLSDCF